MDIGNCVVNFEFHYQMCEFLAHSKELIISVVTYQISAFKFSLHHLHNWQSITLETTDGLLIPLAGFKYTAWCIFNFISLSAVPHDVDFPALKSAGKRETKLWEIKQFYMVRFLRVLFSIYP